MTQVVGRLQVERRIIIRHGTSQIVLIIASQSTVDVQACRSRHLHNGPVKCSLCLGILGMLCQEDGLHAQGRALVGIHLQCMVNPLLGLQGILTRQGHLSFERILGRLLRPITDHLVERRIGTRILLQLDLAQHEVVPAVSLHRVDLKCLVIVFLGQLIAALVDTAQGTEHVVVGHVRVALESIATVNLGPLIILEVEFGQTAVEVRLTHPRLGVYHHIEALYRQHVVLIIQSVPPHQEHPFGVDLGKAASAPTE